MRIVRGGLSPYQSVGLDAEIQLHHDVFSFEINVLPLRVPSAELKCNLLHPHCKP